MKNQNMSNLSPQKLFLLFGLACSAWPALTFAQPNEPKITVNEINFDQLDGNLSKVKDSLRKIELSYEGVSERDESPESPAEKYRASIPDYAIALKDFQEKTKLTLEAIPVGLTQIRDQLKADVEKLHSDQAKLQSKLNERIRKNKSKLADLRAHIQALKKLKFGGNLNLSANAQLDAEIRKALRNYRAEAKGGQQDSHDELLYDQETLKSEYTQLIYKAHVGYRNMIRQLFLNNNLQSAYVHSQYQFFKKMGYGLGEAGIAVGDVFFAGVAGAILTILPLPLPGLIWIELNHGDTNPDSSQMQIFFQRLSDLDDLLQNPPNFKNQDWEGHITYSDERVEAQAMQGLFPKCKTSMCVRLMALHYIGYINHLKELDQALHLQNGVKLAPWTRREGRPIFSVFKKMIRQVARATAATYEPVKFDSTSAPSEQESGN